MYVYLFILTIYKKSLQTLVAAHGQYSIHFPIHEALHQYFDRIYRYIMYVHTKSNV